MLSDQIIIVILVHFDSLITNKGMMQCFVTQDEATLCVFSYHQDNTSSWELSQNERVCQLIPLNFMRMAKLPILNATQAS